MKKSDLEKLGSDFGLKPDSKAIILFVAAKGAGKHSVSFDDFSLLLWGAGRKRIRAAIGYAVEAGWISRATGGWGSADFYEFTPPSMRSLGNPIEDGTEGSLGNPIENHTEGSLGNPIEGPLSGPQGTPQGGEPSKKPSMRSLGNPIEETFGTEGFLGDPSVIVTPTPRSKNTPLYVPPERKLDEWVGEELENERYQGCRGALRDYLRDRVDLDRQRGYLYTIQTWFDGGLAAPKGFHHLKHEQQTLVLAGALNELLAESPTQEKLNYRSSRGMQGNTATLRSKVEFHIRRHEEVGKQGSLQLEGSTTTNKPSVDRYGRERVPFPEEVEKA